MVERLAGRGDERSLLCDDDDSDEADDAWRRWRAPDAADAVDRLADERDAPLPLPPAPPGTGADEPALPEGRAAASAWAISAHSLRRGRGEDML